MKELKSEDVKNIILKYIRDDRRQQAVVLDGPWGCGKSYFVKNVLIPEFEKLDDYQVHCVSLYGMSEVSSIQDAIYASWLEGIVETKAGAKGVAISKGIGIFGKGFIKFVENKLGTEGEATEGAKNLIGGLVGKNKKPIIIIDDLERCQIDIIEIMGFLNNLVENNQYRMLIIANESEILNDDNDLLRTLQYKIALDKRISIPNLGNSCEEEKNILHKEELEARREYIFSKKNIYDRTREKLIGLTVPYSTKIEEVFEDILNKYVTKDNTKSIITKHKNEIIESFERAGNRNLRTLIAAFIAMDEIVSIIADSKIFEGDFSCYVTDELVTILKYVVITAIKRSEGVELFKWPTGTRYGNINGGKYGIEKNSIYGYAFIDEYWDSLVLNQTIVEADISAQLAKKKSIDEMKKKNIEHESLALNMLKDWYLLPDDDVKRYIAQMKKELQEKKYYPQDFKDIIHVLMCINNPNFGLGIAETAKNTNGTLYDLFDIELTGKEQIEIQTPKGSYDIWEEVNISEYVDLMYLYFEDSYEITKRMFKVISENKQYVIEFRIHVAKILDELEKREIEKIKYLEGCDSLFVEMQWNDEFVSYCHAQRDVFLNNGRFMSLFEYSDLVNNIRKATEMQLHNLCDAMRTVYYFSNLGEVYDVDYSIIHQIKNFVEEGINEAVLNSKRQRTLEIAFTRLLNDLKKYDEKLSKPVM